MKLTDKDLEFIARGRARQTKASKVLWLCTGIVLIVWLVGLFAINIYGITVYHCMLCVEDAFNFANVTGFILFIIFAAIAAVIDYREKKKILVKLRRIK